MAGSAVQEDTIPCNLKISSFNKQSVLVDIDSVKSKNLKLVSFNPISELVALEENLALRYRMSKSFHPKSGDWIGLFQVSHTNADKYLYYGFHWAQKHPYEKKKPLERLVHFRINEFNIPVNCGKDTYYQFLYMTHSEKLVGCSNIFGIRIHVPLIRRLNATPETTSAVMRAPVTCQKQSALVPYEFYHQQYAQLRMENTVIHLCFEDLAARRCVIDPIKYPVSHRYAGCQGLKDWTRLAYSALSSYSRPNSCTLCRQSKEIIRSLQRRVIMLRKSSKQCPVKDCICPPKEVDSLKNEVKQLKQKVLLLEETLSKEGCVKLDLIRNFHHMEQEMLQKLEGMTTWLMQKGTFMCQNQHPVSFTSTGKQSKDQVHFSQSHRPRFNTADSQVNLNIPGITSESPEVKQNEELNPRSIVEGLKSTLKKKKVSLSHNTYSGSRIGLRYLFKENAPRNHKRELPLGDETYSGSNLSLRFLFGETIPDKARKEQHFGKINCYSGSNHSLQHPSDDRFYERTPAAYNDTYSGSNIALSYLFSEENEDATTSFKASAENSSCAKCFCQCKSQTVNERRDKVLHDVSSYKTGTESMNLKKENVDEGSKKKTEKSVQISSKKLCVYFQNDRDLQEELQLNDETRESNPATGSNYIVEFKDKHLVKVTGQANGTSASQNTKSPPVSDTTQMAAGIDVTKAPVASSCHSIARPKPEPRKKSKRSPGIINSTHLTTKHANEDTKDAVIQVDGLLYSGGVYWVSSDLPTLAKTAPPISSVSCQAASGVIPPTKSLTVSAVAATDGKQDMSKDSAILTTQADISRDAKSAYSLGKTEVNSRCNETGISSNPTMTSTNCRPAANKNSVTGSGAQGTAHIPTMVVGTLQSIEMTDVVSMSQLTVINDLNIISIPTSTDAAATQALHTLERVTPDAATTTPHVTSGQEENKKRKRFSVTGSSALSKSKNTDDSPLAMPTKKKIPKNACLASGSEFSNFIYTVKPRLPKSPTMPLAPDDLARSSTLIQPTNPQSPPLTASHCPTGTSGAIQSTKSESKTLPLMSVHSTGTGSRNSTQLTKVLPPPSCPLLPPPNQARLQPAFQSDNNEEYPPLPSAQPNVVEMKPSAGQDDTSYASATKRDKKPVGRPQVAMCSLQSLAKIAKDIILKYYKTDEEMKALYANAAIPKDISLQHDSQKEVPDKTSQDNEQESVQDTVENTILGNAQKTLSLDIVSAPELDSSKTIKLSAIITESLREENDQSSTTEDFLAINQTHASTDPSNNNLTATLQQDEDSLKTSCTAAAQEHSVKTNTASTKRQEFSQTEDAQSHRQDIKKKVTMKTGQKDKYQASSKRQCSKKADLSTKQHNVNTDPTGHESIKTTVAQSIIQRETSQKGYVKTDLNTTPTDSPTIDHIRTATPNPPLTGPTPDSQNPPITHQTPPAAQNVKNTNETPPKGPGTNQKGLAKANPSTTTQPDPQESRNRSSKPVANVLQEDESRHT